MSKTTTGLRVTLPAADMARALRFASRGCTPQKYGPVLLDHIHVTVGDNAFAGLGEDWAIRSGGVGMTAAGTDRFRLHLAGALSAEDAVHGEVNLSVADVRTALRGAPTKHGAAPATLEWDGTNGPARLTWPKSTWLIDTDTSHYPKVDTLFANAATADMSTGAAFTAKYVSEALLGLTAYTRQARLRLSGLKPAIVATPVVDSMNVAAALVMPVREGVH